MLVASGEYYKIIKLKKIQIACFVSMTTKTEIDSHTKGFYKSHFHWRLFFFLETTGFLSIIPFNILVLFFETYI